MWVVGADWVPFLSMRYLLSKPVSYINHLIQSPVGQFSDRFIFHCSSYWNTTACRLWRCGSTYSITWTQDRGVFSALRSGYLILVREPHKEKEAGWFRERISGPGNETVLPRSRLQSKQGYSGNQKVLVTFVTVVTVAKRTYAIWSMWLKVKGWLWLMNPGWCGRRRPLSAPELEAITCVIIHNTRAIRSIAYWRYSFLSIHSLSKIVQRQVT